MNLKILHAKALLAWGITGGIFIEFAFIVMCLISEENRAMPLIITILWALGLVVGMIRTYRGIWIQYGDGKIVVRRYSTEEVNGRPVGKRRYREDEFLLEDIKMYGDSMSILGKFVDYYAANTISGSYEYFFKLKNGKYIGFLGTNYMQEQMLELNRYIKDETGIEFKGILRKSW